MLVICRSPHVIALVGFTFDGRLGLLFERADQADLFSDGHVADTHAALKQVMIYMCQMLAALVYMHVQKILHW